MTIGDFLNKEDRKKLVAARLRSLRLSSGLTQKQVALLTYVHPVTYAGYENFSAEPPLDAMVRFADFYGVSLDYLFCRTDTRLFFDKAKFAALDADRNALLRRICDLEHQICETREKLFSLDLCR